MDDLVTFITSSVEIHTPTVGVVFAAILVCLLLYVSGFASGSEIAFFSLSPNGKCYDSFVVWIRIARNCSI